MRGTEKTPYSSGYYHGVIKFPGKFKLINFVAFKLTIKILSLKIVKKIANFPFSAPSLSILTPNGRFKTNTKLCLSMR